MDSTSLPIVVAFDGSDDATLALHWAVDLAERNRQAVRAVVVGLNPESVAPPMKEYEDEFARAAAAMARDILKHASGITTEVVIRYGGVLAVLHEQAQRAGLLVVGSHGHGVVENHWLGSVSHHLAGHASCPVAVVRPAHNPGAKQIVVGVDGSVASARALAYACDLASLTGEQVVAVHAYQHRVFDNGGLAVLPQDIDTSYIDAAERLVAELVVGARVDFPDVELRSTAVLGRPGRVLARLSDDASLVVVGSRGHNTFQELILGSVAQECLRRAECPVVVVR